MSFTVVWGRAREGFNYSHLIECVIVFYHECCLLFLVLCCHHFIKLPLLHLKDVKRVFPEQDTTSVMMNCAIHDPLVSTGANAAGLFITECNKRWLSCVTHRPHWTATLDICATLWENRKLKHLDRICGFRNSGVYNAFQNLKKKNTKVLFTQGLKCRRKPETQASKTARKSTAVETDSLTRINPPTLIRFTISTQLPLKLPAEDEL